MHDQHRGPDWFKNVVAAGSAVIVNEGATVNERATVKVDHPEVVPPEAATPFIEGKERHAFVFSASTRF